MDKTLRDMRSMISQMAEAVSADTPLSQKTLDYLTRMGLTVHLAAKVSKSQAPSHEHRGTNGKHVHVRKCKTCGKGMSEGYLGEDGGTWCSNECLFVNGYTHDMYEVDFENDACFWTDWEYSDHWGEAWDENGERYLHESGTDLWRPCHA